MPLRKVVTLFERQFRYTRQVVISTFGAAAFTSLKKVSDFETPNS